jgi:1,4-alpha-glucan branching enzyme
VANGAFKRLVDAAHEKGMKVIVGVAPNHVGHNFTFRDLFEKPEGGIEVVRNRFDQIAVNPDQLAHVERMLKSDSVQQHEKDYAEYLFPWMYATRDDKPEGAGHVGETMSEWWYGDWSDIKKLNHGGHMAMGHTNGNSPQQVKVRDWIARWMAHAATELGVDGFRIDHSNGMAENFLNRTLTQAQRLTDKYLGHHKPLFMMPEDHDRKGWTAQRVDLIQSEWWHALLDACAHGNPDQFFSTIQNPWFFEVKATDTHDTGRGVNAFNGDLLAYGRYVITTMLSGGPFMMMMGSEYGEMRRTNFKAAEHVPSLYAARIGQLADSQIELNRWISKAGHLKKHPAIKTRHLQRMNPHVLDDNTARTIAFTKHPEHAGDNRVMVFSNLANRDYQAGTFALDGGTRGWLEGRDRDSGGRARFQVKNLLSDDPGRHLWSEPKSAAELIRGGVFAQLKPYEIQALELIQV